MTPSLATALKDRTTLAGLILLAISFLGFAFTIDVYTIDFGLFSGMFFLNYGLLITYFIVVCVENKRALGKVFRFKNFTHNIILLQLFNISAYSLNRNIPVFNISTNWVVAFLLLSNALLLLHALQKDHKYSILNYLTVAVCSVASLFHIYESFYVTPIYPFGIMGFWFFGIPLHVFVPVLMFWANLKVVGTFLKKSNRFWRPAAISWSLALGLVIYISVRFHQINQLAKDSFHITQQPFEDNTLPSWLELSKALPKDWVTKRALKSGLTFTSVDHVFRDFGSVRINERLKHDPLVVLATFFAGAIDLHHDDRINILNYLFDARHQTARKLWRGDNLSTTDIVTNVQLFPSYRIAYTEKTFKIHNSQVDRWRNQQEAFYTFHLPEGAVVTSAALWVNGVEEPAYLTTKSKADSAYKAIVGVERRDPLLLHWQEGNRVTVRVFPCTPDEDRQFKIGVTTPLRYKDDQLVYENIDFQGPYWKGAKESINIVSEGPLINYSGPYAFKEQGTSYTYSGAYRSDWTLSFDAVKLSETPFQFNGKSYQLQPYTPQKEVFKPKNIYLDINAGWTKKEIATIWNAIEHKTVFVYANKRMQQVRPENQKALFKLLRKQNFDLFPFYKIADPEASLVITKYNQTTPTLKDLGSSIFLSETSKFFKANEAPVRVFNIGTLIAPYLKTLKEIRAIQLENHSIGFLFGLLAKQQFYKNQENEHTIINAYAGFQISASERYQNAKTTAPDHLMRLFVYNDLLRTIGKDYFNKKFLELDLAKTAEEAYVVTPISSLIVLETQQDYDRFDIKKSKNSLGNAAIKDSGAVPEPHEWLLILLVLGCTTFLYFKK